MHLNWAVPSYVEFLHFLVGQHVKHNTQNKDNEIL